MEVVGTRVLRRLGVLFLQRGHTTVPHFHLLPLTHTHVALNHLNRRKTEMKRRRKGVYIYMIDS